MRVSRVCFRFRSSREEGTLIQLSAVQRTSWSSKCAIAIGRLVGGLRSGSPGIDDVLLRWAGALPVQGPEPDRPGLAEQLQGTLEAPPAAPAVSAPLGGPGSVASPGQLRTLLVALATHFARGRVPTTARLARGCGPVTVVAGRAARCPRQPATLRNQETA